VPYAELLNVEENETSNTGPRLAWLIGAVVLLLCLAFWAVVIAAIVVLI
jgi:hypothetical protein